MKHRPAPPPGLSPEEEATLQQARDQAYRLDLGLFSLCGIRFGWSSVVGLVPAVGDLADMLLALMLFRICCRAKLCFITKLRMQLNILLDLTLGLLPVVGDLADASFKCNMKNVLLLERELERRGAHRLKNGSSPTVASCARIDTTGHIRQHDVEAIAAVAVPKNAKLR